MARYKIARVIDQFGWCYNFIANEHAKYSKHEIIPVKYDEINVEEYDMVYIHSPDICTPQIERICNNCKACNIPVIGGYAGDPAYWTNFVHKVYEHIDLAVGISPQTYKFCIENYPGRAIFMPESVDNKFFVKGEDRGKYNFVVGWAGGLHKQVKRSHILDRLKYPVKKQAKWDVKEFVKDRTQNHMVDFYHGIDVLVVTSITECQPRVVLEAMACGKIVVSTDVGNIRMLIDEQWIVPKIPETLVIKEMNDRLRMLEENRSLRIEIAERNIEHVGKCFSWQSNVAYWDLVFESVIKKDVRTAVGISEIYLKNNELKKFLE